MSKLALLPGLLLIGAGIAWTVMLESPEASADGRRPLRLKGLEGRSACLRTDCQGCALDFESLVNKWGPPRDEESTTDWFNLEVEPEMDLR